MPGVLVTIAFFAVLLGVPAGEGRSPGRIDAPGAVLLAMALAVLTGGLSLLRLTPGAATPWLVTGGGVVLLGLFVLLELPHRGSADRHPRARAARRSGRCSSPRCSSG